MSNVLALRDAFLDAQKAKALATKALNEHIDAHGDLSNEGASTLKSEQDELRNKLATATTNENTASSEYYTDANAIFTSEINSFDNDSEEEIYIAGPWGNLKPDNYLDADQGNSASLPNNNTTTRMNTTYDENSDKANVVDSARQHYLFKTQEGTRYIWTNGNTYTFGGSKDYSFGNSYSVSISEAISKSDFNCWDGSFPWDIVNPANSKADTSRNNNALMNKEGLPSGYHVYALAPALNSHFFREPNFATEKNKIEKNIGHKYEYQLGDTYEIGVHKNTHEVKIVDLEHNFESVAISENHSHAGIKADFNAHGLDVELGIKAIDFSLNMFGLRATTDYALADFSYESVLYKVVYEDAGKSYRIIDRPQVVFSDENIKTLTSKKVHTVAHEGIIFQVDTEPRIGNLPAAVLGKQVPLELAGKPWRQKLAALGTAVKNKAPDLINITAWWRAVRGGVEAAESEFDSHLLGTDSNSDRDNYKPTQMKDPNNPAVPKNKTSLKSYTRLDLDTEAASITAFADAGTMSEAIFNPKLKLIELNLRDKTSRVYDKKLNFTQHFGLTDGLFVTSYYGATESTFSRIWFAGADITLANNNTLKAFTGGIEVQEKSNTFSKLFLDTKVGKADLQSQTDSNKISEVLLDSTDAKSSVTLRSKLSDDKFVEEKLDAKSGKYDLKVNKEDAKLEMSKGNAKVTVKDGDQSSLWLKKNEIRLDTAKISLNGKDLTQIKSKKVNLDAPEVLVGEHSFKKMDIKMAASNVTIGAAAKIKVTSASIDIKGPKTTIAGTSIAEIKAALVKLG